LNNRIAVRSHRVQRSGGADDATCRIALQSDIVARESDLGANDVCGFAASSMCAAHFQFAEWRQSRQSS